MTISLTFLGAARTVTGSCLLVATGGAKLLVDCGMFQGAKTLKALNYEPFPFAPAEIDAVLLTHAHIDHSGLLPKLVKHGYRGPIHATAATIDLCSVMLPDSGHIQEMEVDALNQRGQLRGDNHVTPIYTAAEALACMEHFRPVAYGAWISPVPSVRARWWNAGHLLGSASIELEIEASDGGEPLRLLVSGDIGPSHKLLQPDPAAPSGFDYVICEATYGDVERRAKSDEVRRARLAAEIREAARRKGALLVPSFAVERTQELVTDLVTLMDDGEVAQAPIVIDSPLALRASEIFLRHAGSLDNGRALVAAFRSPHLKFAETVEQSRALARLEGFRIIIAASGMCDAGRIRHHLKDHLWRTDATLLLVGYQAHGTLGRLLLDGMQFVRIQGEEVRVRCRIRSLDDYSGHADGAELAAWLGARLPIRRGLFLVHGEDEALDGLSRRAATRLPPSVPILRPALDETYALGAQGPALAAPSVAPRLRPGQDIRLDWHNDLTQLIIDINERVRGAADERGRQVILRQLRRALRETAPDQ